MWTNDAGIGWFHYLPGDKKDLHFPLIMITSRGEDYEKIMG
jgi:hypothetical protein